ncbi:hypothetical protein GY45DRAFT_135906 [Cubamyces sp. BRFM 1775]|nr:hypothetical protein GY45DRAFT_135906 [Cubamyces sp. BRFM 1775]
MPPCLSLEYSGCLIDQRGDHASPTAPGTVSRWPMRMPRQSSLCSRPTCAAHKAPHAVSVEPAEVSSNFRCGDRAHRETIPRAQCGVRQLYPGIPRVAFGNSTQVGNLYTT